MPDNCSLMVIPKVNTEIWKNIIRQALSSDVYLQEVEKSMIANQLAIIKLPIDPHIFMSELSDSISLLAIVIIVCL